MTDSTIPHNAPSEPTVSLLRLKAATAAKLGQHARGEIHYELLADSDHRALFLRLTSSDGGGNFSPELVPFIRIQTLVTDLPDSPVPSRVFRPCFRGRSQNNAGFLCCLLRAEGLLTSTEGKMYQHRVVGDWSAWAAETLPMPGELIELPLSLVGDALPLDTPASAPVSRRRRNKLPQGESGEQGDACAAQ